VCWMSTHWQKRQYMTPWDENGLLYLLFLS